MAVYFQPQYKPWWADLASATLSGLVKGMLDRDAAARAQRVNSNRWGEFEKLYDEASGQYAAPRESPLTIQGAPETKKLSQLSAPQQNAFGSDPFGGVPEQFRPQEGDGLVGTAVKALQNNAIRGRTPTIDDVYKWGAQSGAINDPNFQKFVEARFGSRFKMQDAARLADRLGNMPQFNDRQGTLEYVGNRTLYDPDGAKTVGNFIQHLNPGFNNQAVNLGNRQVVLSQDPYTGRTAPVFSGAVGVSPDRVYHNARADFRAQGGADTGTGAGGGSGIRKMAEPYVRAIVNAQKQAGAGQVPEMGPEDFDRLVNTINYECGEYAPAVLDYIGSLPALLSPGEGDNADDFGPVATRANPFRGPYERYVGTSRRIHLPAHEGEEGKVSPAAPEGPGETLRQRQVRELVALTGKSPEEVERYLAEKNRAAPQRPAPKSEVKKPSAPVRSFADEVADVQRKRRNWTPW